MPKERQQYQKHRIIFDSGPWAQDEDASHRIEITVDETKLGNAIERAMAKEGHDGGEVRLAHGALIVKATPIKGATSA